jgi:chromate reductase
MPDRITVLGICGSLRRASYNRMLLNAALECAPVALHIDIYDGLGDIPLYNEDVREAGEPDAVSGFKHRIREADALLIASPEYNYSVPGVLKNAIDWASRPPAESPLMNKPAAIVGASTGNFGTARGQLALRQVFVFTGTQAMLKPELLVFQAQKRFDESGRLTDDMTRKLLTEFMAAFEGWVRQFAPAKASAQV